MKKFLSILMLLMMSLTLLVVPAFAEEEVAEEGGEEEYYGQEFQLKNSSGAQIAALFIAPSEEEDNWGESYLAEPFAPDTIISVAFDVEITEGSLWNIRCDDGNGNFVDFKGIDLTAVKGIELSVTDGKPTATTFPEAFEAADEAGAEEGEEEAAEEGAEEGEEEAPAAE